MAKQDSKAIEELKDKVDYLERYLVEEGETEAAKFMMIIGGMLDHMVRYNINTQKEYYFLFFL